MTLSSETKFYFKRSYSAFEYTIAAYVKHTTYGILKFKVDLVLVSLIIVMTNNMNLETGILTSEFVASNRNYKVSLINFYSVC